MSDHHIHVDLDPDPMRPLRSLEDALARVDAVVFRDREHPAVATLRELLAHVEDPQAKRVSTIHASRLIRRAIAEIGGKV
ncbi:MAG: hypothetical protein IT537_08190 [Hyphomicrobiales bacterium]|nr:hypothetical protein [Hyphomicrobiales bacterium]